MKKLDGFREVFKTVKHRKPSQIFCPRCASSKIHLHSGLDLWLTPQSYICEDCGYNGIIVMELEKDEESTEENKENNEA
jgi:transposase-like protein